MYFVQIFRIFVVGIVVRGHMGSPPTGLPHVCVCAFLYEKKNYYHQISGKVKKIVLTEKRQIKIVLFGSIHPQMCVLFMCGLCTYIKKLKL